MRIQWLMDDFIILSERKWRRHKNVILSDHRKENEDTGKAWFCLIIGRKIYLRRLIDLENMTSDCLFFNKTYYRRISKKISHYYIQCMMLRYFSLLFDSLINLDVLFSFLKEMVFYLKNLYIFVWLSQSENGCDLFNRKHYTHSDITLISYKTHTQRLGSIFHKPFRSS